MDFYEDYRSAPWERVTRKVVDPITFLCTPNIEFMPRTEDCAYETTGVVIAEPRFGERFIQTRSGDGGAAGGGQQDSSWTPLGSGAPVTRAKKKFSQYGGTPKPKKKNSLKDTLGSKPASLGAFFQKSSIENLKDDMDNMSLGSKSMNSRSIADRSNAERSKSEDKLKRRKNRKNSKSVSSGSTLTSANSGTSKQQVLVSDDVSVGMESIDEYSTNDWNSVAEMKSVAPSVATGPSRTSGLGSSSSSSNPTATAKGSMGPLSNFLEGEDDDDDKSLTLEQVGPPEKKLRFQDGHEVREIPYPTNSMYDDLFWGSEELADFRYEAFLEEAGLDVDEYM